MKLIKEITPKLLCPKCDPKQFTFETTQDLKDLHEIVGQDRALDAVRFGIGIKREGYNLYALGPPGVGKQLVIRRELERQATKQPCLPDWCYVHNFSRSQHPATLQLPTGYGKKLRSDMDILIEALLTAIPAILESEEFRGRMQKIEEEFKRKQDKAFDELQKKAEEKGLTILSTQHGFAVAPTRNGEVLSTEEFEELPEGEQKQKHGMTQKLREELSKLLDMVPMWQQERRQKEKNIEKKMTMSSVRQLIDPLRKKYEDCPPIIKYLNDVQQDVTENAKDFKKQPEGIPMILGGNVPSKPSFNRYKINVLVDHSECNGAPVIYEDNPTYPNLIGRVEHVAQLGALITDFTLIRAGALHRANGGYLILDIYKLLMNPYAWEGLKRALHAHQIQIESMGQMLGLLSSVTLEPEPIELDVKIVLTGERLLYHLLCAYDPDFRELFKVAADFEEEIERSIDNNQLYARLIGTLAHKEDMKPFHRKAVARIIDQSARLVDDAERLSIHMRSVTDLLRESDYWAREASHKTVKEEDVQHAIDTQVRRADRERERLYEEIDRGTILIDTQGAKVGQVNGLSVIQLGDFRFGQPSRITATTRVGEGDVVDIEREVELGGPIHSKGVLIISGYLRGNYAKEKPLSLAASLVFEQSYGQVEGDSASVGELCALLSALAQAPINQFFAVTGSINQLGEVQPIGGVNEKIEGFFDVCKMKGLTGTQGVLIPASNVKNLMLREDVVAAAKKRKFHIYPIKTIDQAISMLTGLPAGERDKKGQFPKDSLNGRVERCLVEYAEHAEKKPKK